MIENVRPENVLPSLELFRSSNDTLKGMAEAIPGKTEANYSNQVR